MSIFEALGLGFIHGLTGFLPISLNGHLMIASKLFSNEGSYTLAFDTAMQLAVVLSVIIYFRKDISLLINTALRRLSRLPINKSDETLLYTLLIGAVPAIILELSLASFFKTLLFIPFVVAGILFSSSIFYIYAEWRYLKQNRVGDLNIKKGVIIGIFQALSILPGISRIGATMTAGMLQGFSRSEATRFSFLLALPVILAISIKKLLKLIINGSNVDWIAISIGATTAFITGIFAIHFMLSFMRKHTLWSFIWYQIILAGFIIFIVVFG